MAYSVNVQNSFNTITALLKRFPSDKSCTKYLQKIRWNGKPFCPRCNSYKVYRFKDGKTFKCPSCKRLFNVKIGTIFEGSNVSFRDWFVAIYFIVNQKKGISSLQLHRNIGVTQKTAWFMLHRLREMVNKKPDYPLDGVVEVDETYIGGKESNKHLSKRMKGAWSGARKTPLVGLIERGSEVRVKVVDSTKAKDLIPVLLNNIKPDAFLMTDQNNTYKRTSGYYRHFVVNHSIGEYARGSFIHTNTIEGFWSHLKRMINGTYHNISLKHTQRYCDSMGFRYNTRALSHTDRFNLALSMCAGRLKYKKLIED